MLQTANPSFALRNQRRKDHEPPIKVTLSPLEKISIRLAMQLEGEFLSAGQEDQCLAEWISNSALAHAGQIIATAAECQRRPRAHATPPAIDKPQSQQPAQAPGTIPPGDERRR